LDELEKSMDEDGLLVTKQYVKGRENIYSHPAIGDYNRTSDAANKTVNTLMKIILSLRRKQKTETDEFDDFINSRDE
jgi:hypothetical protein